jgi:uncharacterized delta-60 repeat protein
MSDEEIRALAIAPNGKIVVVGSVEVGTINPSEDELLVYRYNMDGTVDTTFSEDGRVVLDLGDAFGGTLAFNVAVEPDGQIVVVGTNYKVPDYDFFVMRLNDNGSKDFDIVEPISGDVLHAGFDHDGVKNIGLATTMPTPLCPMLATSIAGTVNFGSGIFFGGVTKLSSLGGFVSSFHNDGKANFSVPGSSVTTIQDLILQGDKVVIAGNTVDPSSGQNNFYVARFTSAGVLDTTFGEGNQGFTVTDLGGNDVVKGITVTPTGGGGGFIVSGGSNGMAAVKYTVNGLLDTSFASAGSAAEPARANIAPGPGRRSCSPAAPARHRATAAQWLKLSPSDRRFRRGRLQITRHCLSDAQASAFRDACVLQSAAPPPCQHAYRRATTTCPDEFRPRSEVLACRHPRQRDARSTHAHDGHDTLVRGTISDLHDRGE